MQHVGDYEGILMAVQRGSTKAKQLAAQLIPKFFKFFPGLASKAASAHFDLLEEEELGVISAAVRLPGCRSICRLCLGKTFCFPISQACLWRCILVNFADSKPLKGDRVEYRL